MSSTCAWLAVSVKGAVGAVRQDEEATLGEEIMTAFHDIGEKPG